LNNRRKQNFALNYVFTWFRKNAFSSMCVIAAACNPVKQDIMTGRYRRAPDSRLQNLCIVRLSLLATAEY